MPAMQESVLEPSAAVGLEVESRAAEVDIMTRVPNPVRHRELRLRALVMQSAPATPRYLKA